MSTIIIDDNEYQVADLSEDVQASIARVQMLQKEISELRMVIEERMLVLQARQNAIVEAVKAADGDSDADAA